MKPLVVNADARAFDTMAIFRENRVVLDAARKLARAEGYPLAAVLRGLLRDWVDAKLNVPERDEISGNQ